MISSNDFMRVCMINVGTAVCLLNTHRKPTRPCSSSPLTPPFLPHLRGNIQSSVCADVCGAGCRLPHQCVTMALFEVGYSSAAHSPAQWSKICQLAAQTGPASAGIDAHMHAHTDKRSGSTQWLSRPRPPNMLYISTSIANKSCKRLLCVCASA